MCALGGGRPSNSPAPGKCPAIQLSSNTVHLEMASDPTVQCYLNCRTAKGIRGLSRWSTGKESAFDAGSTLGSEGSLEEGNDNPLQYSCLENPMDRGAWKAPVHGATELDMTDHACTKALVVALLTHPVSFGNTFNYMLVTFPELCRL